MFKLSRYLVRETLGLYVFGVAAFCLLLSIDKLVGWADFLIRYEASPATIGSIMLYTLPQFLHQAMPIAIVFAILLATGRLAKDSELKAAYSLGVRPWALLVPLLIVGLVVSGITLFNNGYLEPVATEIHDDIVDSFFYDRPPAEAQSNVAFRSEDQGIFFAARVIAQEGDSSRAELSGVLVLPPDGTSTTALNGVWDSRERTWTLFNAERVATDGEREELGTITLDFSADTDATARLADQETLTLTELGERIDRSRTTASETRPLRHLFHTRIADAFSALSFSLIAGILGLQLHGRASGFAWTIALLVLFWAVWVFSGSLFEQGVLAPIPAAWLTSGLVAALGFGVAWVRLR